MTCQICCEKYNKTINQKIICPIGNCNFEACKKCTRQYLLSNTKDPNCMKCNAQWNQQFVIEKLNKSFWDNEYKNHRTKILSDIEISKIPETIEYAENFSKIEKLKEIKKTIDEKIKELNKEIIKYKEESRSVADKIFNIKNGKEICEKKKFIMPCQNNDCKGYLSSQYKCGLCELYTCPDCFEVIGHSKNDPHICNEDSIKSAEEIKKTTKPCPNCGQRIFKIHGCDQMWCTECKVAFSWNTGKIETNNIHNPHYYEFIKKNGNGEINRNIEDVQCGGLPHFYQLNINILRNCSSLNDVDLKVICNKLTTLHRTISHITYNEIFHARAKINALSDQKDLRANYILKKISKDDLEKQVYNNDKQRRKTQEILHIFELISVYGIEFFRELQNHEFYKRFGNSDKNAFKIYMNNSFDQLSNLIEYCNKQFGIISATYNLTVMQISSNYYTILREKFNIGDLKYLKKSGCSCNNHEASSSSDQM